MRTSDRFSAGASARSMAAWPRISIWSDPRGSRPSVTSWRAGSARGLLRPGSFASWRRKVGPSMRREWPLRLALAAIGLAPSVAAQEPTVQHDYATVNGIRLHYAHAGSGE